MSDVEQARKCNECMCENALCCDHGQGDEFALCQRKPGQGWIQFLGFVCDTCYHNYPKQYQCGFIAPGKTSVYHKRVSHGQVRK